MQLQKYREACAKAWAALHELKDPHRKLTESETRAIVRNVDQLFGLTFAYEVDDTNENKPDTSQPGEAALEPPTGPEPEPNGPVGVP